MIHASIKSVNLLSWLQLRRRRTLHIHIVKLLSRWALSQWLRWIRLSWHPLLSLGSSLRYLWCSLLIIHLWSLICLCRLWSSYVLLWHSLILLSPLLLLGYLSTSLPSNIWSLVQLLLGSNLFSLECWLWFWKCTLQIGMSIENSIFDCSDFWFGWSSLLQVFQC